MIIKVGDYYFKDESEGFQRVIPSRQEIQEALQLPKRVKIQWLVNERQYSVKVELEAEPATTYIFTTFTKAAKYRQQLIEIITDRYLKQAIEAPEEKELLVG